MANKKYDFNDVEQYIAMLSRVSNDIGEQVQSYKIMNGCRDTELTVGEIELINQKRKVDTLLHHFKNKQLNYVLTELYGDVFGTEKN